MNQKARGRLYQDDNFIFTEFNGLKIERLIVCENPETKNPIIIYLKVENNNWHRYFLDTGFGCWENWEILDTDDDSYNYLDKTAEFNLFNKTIYKIWCAPHEHNSQIIIEFENNEKLILRTIEPKIFDSESELILIEHHNTSA